MKSEGEKREKKRARGGKKGNNRRRQLVCVSVQWHMHLSYKLTDKVFLAGLAVDTEPN